MTTEKIQNAKSFPQVYFGLHMNVGVAEYKKPGKDPERIFIGERAIREMDGSFAGLPVYVGHVEDVDLDVIHEADGYVIKSFYNPADGATWCQFIVTSDRGHEAIRAGHALSNCYTPGHDFGPGGEWHGVPYAREVKSGKYDHMAVVDDPRYAESSDVGILTEEEFKEYNRAKEAETQRFANSKEKESMGFKLFKRTKIENAKELNLDETIVELELSKKEMSLSDAIKTADKYMNMNGYANGEHYVKAGDEEMTVNQLGKKYNAAMAELAEMKKANEADDGDMENEEDDEDREKEIEKRKNAADEREAGSEVEKEAEAESEVEVEAEKPAEKKANSKVTKSKANFDKIANAASRASRQEEEPARVDLMSDKVARGKLLF